MLKGGWDRAASRRFSSQAPSSFLLMFISLSPLQGLQVRRGHGRQGVRLPLELPRLAPTDLDRTCRTAYASFGGLLMALSGSYRHISGVTVGEYVYLLIRR